MARIGQKKSTAIRSPLSGWIVLYGLIVVLSGVFGYNPSNSFENLHWFFNWLIIYFAIIWTVRTRTQFFIFLALYLLFNFKLSQTGFLSWAAQGFGFDAHGTGGPGWLRNSGEFGIQMCIFTPLAVAFALALRRHCSTPVRWILYFIPITAIGAILASASRGALAGLGASSLWSIRTGKHFVRTLILVGTLLLLAYAALPEEFKERLGSSGADRTSLVRLDRWEKGWETIKKYPVLGVGHKNWEIYYGDHLNYGLPGTRMVHNIFIESGTEHGLLGLGTLCALLISMLFVNARTRALARDSNDTFSIYIAHGMDAAIWGMVISSSFVTVLYYPYVWIHAAFVASLHISVLPAGKVHKRRRGA